MLPVGFPMYYDRSATPKENVLTATCTDGQGQVPLQMVFVKPFAARDVFLSAQLPRR